MTRVNYSMKHVVQVEVDDRGLHVVRGPPIFGMLPPEGVSDGGLIPPLLAWLFEEDLEPLAYGFPLPWRYVATFAPKDGERVVEWLQQHGANQEGQESST